MRSPRRPLAAGGAALGLLAVLPGVGAAAVAHPAARQSHCPPAESLVPGTAWHHHRLAPGVTITAGTAKDAQGEVNMHVLRVDLTRPRVSIRPLIHSVGERLPLSQLAAHHPRLVAATNTGYFDFEYGAPTVPLIAGGHARVLSTRPQWVVGIGKSGRMQAGRVWEAGTVRAGADTRPLAAVNEVSPPAGLALYDHRWGHGHVPGGWSTSSRAVVGGDVAAVNVPRRGATVPKNGYLLRARGQAAADWLAHLSAGHKVSVASRVRTDAASRFVQAYGVGVELVAAGAAHSGFTCSSANTKTPARTAIGWSDGGRTMIVALVADHPHTSMHGLDEDQMAKLMAQLGASRAYAFDGSGSTELLAKLAGTTSLVRQTYPSDGVERPMPLGLGVSVAPPKHH